MNLFTKYKLLEVPRKVFGINGKGPPLNVAASRMKLGLALLLAVLAPLAAVSTAMGADVKSMEMKEAVQLSIGRNGELREARTNIRQKQVELEQAHYAQKSEEEKASGLFAKPRNLSQQLQVRMKVPEARMQLTIAEEKLRQKSIEVKQDAEKSYLQVYQSMQAEQAARAKRDEAQQELDAVQQKLKYGLAKQADKDAAQQALEQAASAYKQAQLTAKGARIAFGEKLGVGMEQPFAMSFEPVYADLSQSMLPGYIDRAMKTNISLIQDMQARKLADEKLNVTRNLYSSKFGESRMKAFDRLLGGKELDMDLFSAQYESLLGSVDQDWEGLIWIILPLPKKLFQGEYDGLRYLDDLRNGLPLAAMEQNKAALKEKESRSAVIAAVRQSYLDAKGAEETYVQSLRTRDKAFDEIGKVDTMRRLGLAAQEEAAAAKEAYEQTRALVLSSQIAYMNAIGKLNADTGGALEQTYRQGVLPYEQIDDGLGPVKPAPEKPASGKWSLKQAVGDLLSDMTVTPDKKLKATQYELIDGAGKRVVEKTDVGKPVRVLTLYFAEPNKMKVALYRGKEKIGEASLEGSATMGSFTLPEGQQEAAAAESPAEGAPPPVIIIGTVKANLDALTPDIWNAAAATMKSSGQGTAFSPDGKDWYAMESITDAAQLNDPNGKAALAPSDVATLKVTMEITGAGELKSLLTSEQLAKEIANLAEELKKLEEDKQKALDAGKPDRLADLTTQVEDAKAQIAMLESLQKGDAKTALKHMALVNNPEAIMAQLAKQQEEPGGGSGSGNGSGSIGGSDPDSLTADELAALAETEQAAVLAAVASGDRDAATKAVEALLQTMAKAADAENGITEGLAILAQAEAALIADKLKAEQAGDKGKSESLAGTLTAVQAAVNQLEKELLFAEMAAVVALIDTITAEQAPPPGSAAAAAQAQVVELLESNAAELLDQITEKQQQLYTAEEVLEIAQLAELIRAETGGQAEPLPVQNMISPTIPLKLDVPPFIRDGSAFIPLRAVSESFGAAVDWDEETMTATVSTEYGTVECTIGSSVAYLNGEPVLLEKPPELIVERTFVPLRFLAESIGFEVVWNDAAKTIELY